MFCIRPGRRDRSAHRNEEVEFDENGDEPLPAQEVGLFRAAAARANYLALDRPDLGFAAKELCRRSSTPRRGDLSALRRFCRYLLVEPRRFYHFA